MKIAPILALVGLALISIAQPAQAESGKLEAMAPNLTITQDVTPPQDTWTLSLAYDRGQWIPAAGKDWKTIHDVLNFKGLDATLMTVAGVGERGKGYVAMSAVFEYRIAKEVWIFGGPSVSALVDDKFGLSFFAGVKLRG